MTTATKLAITFFIILFAITWHYDTQILLTVESFRTPALTEFMIIITDFVPFIAGSLLGVYLYFARKYKELLFIAIAVVLSLESAYLLKKIVQIPRPFDLIESLQPASYSTGYTFPSMHAAFSVAIIPFIFRVFKSRWIAGPLALLFLAIAISRTYLGVHFASDILVGGLIGYTISTVILKLDDRYNIYKKLLHNLKTKREVRRQVAHLLTGISLVFLIKFNLINAPILGLVLVTGLGLSLISRHIKLPIIYPLLNYFERPKEIKEFPGKGSFYLVLGAFTALVLFEERIALAAITIMAVGDSITALIGIYIGKFRNPLNPIKHLEGTVSAIIISTLAAFTFVPFEKAFLASAGSMLFEALTIRIIDQQIDDNLLIPLVAGFIMTVMM